MEERDQPAKAERLTDEQIAELVELIKQPGDMNSVAGRLLSNKQYINDLHIRLIERQLPAALELELWRHKWGKPPETVKLAGHDGGPLKAIELRVVDTSD